MSEHSSDEIQQLTQALEQLLAHIQADVHMLHEQVHALEARLEAVEVDQVAHMLAIETDTAGLEGIRDHDEMHDDEMAEELDRLFDIDDRRN